MYASFFKYLIQPAVISVRVKVNAAAETGLMEQNNDEDANPFNPNSPMYKFFRKFDLALIKVDGKDDFGDWVVAVGNPFGLGGTVTVGIVSARGRDIGAGPYDDYVQIDAPINKGNSGGPAFDVEGNVIGVNTSIFSPSGGSVGIGFDIPAGRPKAQWLTSRKKAVQSGWPRPPWQGDDSRAATRRDWRLAPLGSAMKMRRARASCLLEPLVILARGALLLE